MRPREVVLPDSSFYIAEMRRRVDPLAQFEVLAVKYEIATCGPVCCEVGRGMRFPSQLASLHAAWELMVYIPTDNRLWREAEDLLWTLGRRGKQLPLGDAVIACCALRAGAIVLTHDSHFDEVPDLRTASTVRELILR
jgi:predicted nucleic acid-binding protein